MFFYHYDENKKYTKKTNAFIDPLESKEQGKIVYLKPKNATEKEPLPEKEGFDIVFNGQDWEYKQKEKPIEHIPTEKEKKEQELLTVLSNLSSTDYIACKIAEGVATKEEYSEVLAQRQQWREQVNLLKNQIANLESSTNA